jgi:glycosyltransferase involved in cell wall biosynthesis
LLVSRASSFISYGTQAKNYLVGLGADVAKVTIAINTVDVDYFRIETEKLRNGQATNLHGAPKRFLYVGNLEQGKRVDLLIEAVNRLRTKRDDFVLEIIGTGSLESLLKNLAKDNNAVEFHGYLQRSDVAKRLAEASCFVFPSEYDVWGLVLVEAMAAGLPCLASIHCGATSDLIRDDQTGFALDFENIDNVVSRLEWVLDHPTESAEMGARAADFIRNEVTLSQSAAGFVKAIAPLMTAIPATKVGEVSASAVPQAR